MHRPEPRRYARSVHEAASSFVNRSGQPQARQRTRVSPALLAELQLDRRRSAERRLERLLVRLARLARLLLQGDAAQLRSDLSWIEPTMIGQNRRVMVLVENSEHAVVLSRYLPRWRMMTGLEPNDWHTLANNANNASISLRL